MIQIPDRKFHCSADQDFFFSFENPNFQNNLVHTDICEEIDEIDAKTKPLHRRNFFNWVEIQ